MTKMVGLYVWTDPAEKIDSQYGLISAKEWMGKEVARIKADPARTAEIRKKAGKIALFVNKVCEELEGDE